MSQPHCAGIRDIAVVTRNRPACLERCLSSIAHDCHSRDIRIHVFDDASTEEGVTANVAVIKKVEAEYGTAVGHVTREARKRWIDELLRAGHGVVTRATIEHALLGSPSSGVVTGANRNAMMLSLLGRVVVSIDDDVFLPLRESPERAGPISFSTVPDPTEFFFFESCKDALEAWGPSSLDLVAAHEQVLGLTVAQCMQNHGGEPTDELGERGRVAVSMSGLAGDSGMSGTFYYALLPSPSRARWVHGGAALRHTRQILRAAPRITISRANLLMAANIGLDLRMWIPPFMPAGRNQDGPVAVAMRALTPDSYIGHIPFAAPHDPPEPRESSAEQAISAVEQPASSHILMMCMTAWPGNIEQTEPAARTAALGRFLIECTSDVSRFRGLIRTQARRGQELRIGRLEDALASRTMEPDDWADYLRLLLRSALKSLKNPSFPLPCDIEGPASYKMQEVRARIRAYGELLMQWPALREVANDVHRKGSGLTDLDPGSR